MKPNQQLVAIKRIKALAETGLVYAENEYDRERYQELKEIGLQLMAEVAALPLRQLEDFYLPEKDYPTVKVDVRGFVLNERNELLLAKEKIDGKWAIPGGWADIGYTPTEVVLKEIQEETGLICNVERMLAVFDKKMHPHPPQPFYVYKLVFLCSLKGGELRHGFDMDGASFFSMDALPELSEDRILASQLKRLFTLAMKKGATTYFD